ncbi:tetratricopeptide repeat protein [Sphingobacterium olei]|uniref:Tetratricopeptide repeat protein n=1 Tax=Sphingobacterium olei TaxID=2571155 RepID=A0A4U0P273_9SPHI|nr:tetratricopeptide repeat protein [Sphingobacterium olei]TJZ61391.1 tetratricopeptide repeat protein [Sphingobacterium olei]
MHKITKSYTLRLLLTCLYCGVFLTVTVGQEQTKPYKNQLNEVENKLRVGDFGGAIQDLDQITLQYPDAAEVYYAKALLYGQTQNFDLAVDNAKLAYDNEPTLVYANFLLELYKTNDDMPAAIELLRSLRNKNPDDSTISRELIMTLHNAGQSQDALTVYDQLTANAPSSDTLDVIKAEILVDLKRNEEAKQLLNRWSGKSKIRQVYSTLGFIYLQEKNPKQAITIIHKGIDESKDPVLYLDLADAQKASKKDKLAFDALVLAFKSDRVDFLDKHRVLLTLMSPKNPEFSLDQIQLLANELVLRHPRIADSHVLKGEILWRRGNTQEARSLFLTAVGINPKHIDAWRMLINTDLGLNEADIAVQHGMEALNVNPGNAMLMYFTGLAYMVKEDFDSSRKMLEFALDNSLNDNTYLQSIIYASLGDLYHQLKMEAASDVAYEEAIRLDSTNVSAMNNFAYYLSLRKKDLDKAAKYSKLSNEIEPNSSTFQDTYAWVLFQQGNYKDALLWIEKAMKSQNPSAVLYEHYGDILSKVGNIKEAVKQWEKALTLAADTGMDSDKVKLKIREKRYVE